MYNGSITNNPKRQLNTITYVFLKITSKLALFNRKIKIDNYVLGRVKIKYFAFNRSNKSVHFSYLFI